MDLIIANDLRGKNVNRIPLENREIPILARTDLIEMKRESGRRQDIEDIKARARLTGTPCQTQIKRPMRERLASE